MYFLITFRCASGERSFLREPLLVTSNVSEFFAPLLRRALLLCDWFVSRFDRDACDSVLGCLRESLREGASFGWLGPTMTFSFFSITVEPLFLPRPFFVFTFEKLLSWSRETSPGLTLTELYLRLDFWNSPLPLR